MCRVTNVVVVVAELFLPYWCVSQLILAIDTRSCEGIEQNIQGVFRRELLSVELLVADGEYPCQS